jgi:hypothetical protein
MSAENNLSTPQFGDQPKKRWVPDQTGRAIQWHILGWHVKGHGPNSAKSLDRKGLSQYDDKAWHERHMQEHAEGNFEEGKEHDHFTPKKKR